jgi:hypothetical protein
VLAAPQADDAELIGNADFLESPAHPDRTGSRRKMQSDGFLMSLIVGE